jgi:hypothetical protein
VLEKIVQVIFRGKNGVGGPAKQAADDVEGFTSKAGSLLKGLGAAAAALGLASFFKTAVDEAQKSREAMDALANVVDNSGASFKQMAPEIDATLSRLARFSKFGDDEFAGVLRDMTLRTGDASWSLKNLGQAADLAAAAQIPLEAAGQALANAHEGNTKALFKLVPELKGAANWQELLAQKTDGAAEAQMRALGPIEAARKQFGEFAESVGKAILGNQSFEASGAGFADTLANMATWVDENSAAIGEFIDALVLTAQNIIEGFTPAFTVLKRVAGPVLSLLVVAITEMSFAFRAGTVVVEEFAGQAYQSIGKLVQRVGGVLKLLGIEVVSKIGGELRLFGETLDREASARWNKLVDDQKAFVEKLKTGGDKSVADVQTQERTKTRIMKQGLDDRANDAEGASKVSQAAADAYFQKASKTLGKPLSDMIAITTTSIGKLAEAGREQLEPMKAEQFAKHMQHLREQADKGNEAIVNLGQNAGTANENTKKVAADVGAIARAAIDAADAFGVVDDATANALNSVVNMAVAIGKVAAGDLTSIPGIIASAVNLITTMMGGDAARKKLISENTVEMARLRREVGNLSLDVSGDTFAKVQDALGSVMGTIKGGRGARNETDVLNALLARGLGMGDLKKVADELGIRIRSDSGALSVDGLRQLFESMGLVEMGQFGQDFGSQLEATTRGFDVNKTSDVGQIAALGSLGGKFSSVLDGVVNTNNLAETRVRLASIFKRFNEGGFTAQELGGLTGAEFLDLVTNLISRIDSATPADTASTSAPLGISTGDVAAPTGLSSIPAPEAGGIDTGTGPTVEATMLAHAETVIDLLSTHTGLLERTANAGEISADTLVRLYALVESRGGSFADADGLGTMLTLERRLAGSASL